MLFCLRRVGGSDASLSGTLRSRLLQRATLSKSGEPIPEAGKEVFLATHWNAGGKLVEGDAKLASIYTAIVGRVLDGRLK